MTKLELSLHSHSTAAAISSGLPRRRCGVCSTYCASSSPRRRTVHHRRIDPAGTNGVDSNVPLCDLERGGLRETETLVLRRDVRGLLGKADEATDRRAVHDRAAAIWHVTSSYFMHSQTPLRFVAITRSHSFSSYSRVVAVAPSTPALLNA